MRWWSKGEAGGRWGRLVEVEVEDMVVTGGLEGGGEDGLEGLGGFGWRLRVGEFGCKGVRFRCSGWGRVGQP